MSDNLRAALAHVRGLASGEGGDEASRNDPWNALATIVVVCDDALASPASSEPDGEAWTDVPGHGDRQFLVGQSEPSEPGSLRATCPKCGKADIYDSWEPTFKRIERRCRNCRYSWTEQPLDAALSTEGVTR